MRRTRRASPGRSVAQIIAVAYRLDANPSRIKAAPQPETTNAEAKDHQGAMAAAVASKNAESRRGRLPDRVECHKADRQSDRQVHGVWLHLARIVDQVVREREECQGDQRRTPRQDPGASREKRYNPRIPAASGTSRRA